MAIISPTDICNLSQKFLRQSPIADIENPDSKAERTYASLYDQARRVALEMHPWNFASKRVVMALGGPDDQPTHKWKNASALLPGDFIRVNTIGYNDDWDSTMYALEANRILTNEPAPFYLQYVCDFVDISRMSPLFIETFAKRLAGMAAFDMTGNASLQQVLEQSAADALDSAMSSDGQQRPPVRRQVSKWNRARRGAYRRSDPYFLGGP